MLVKKELSEIPVSDYPKLERDAKQYTRIGTAKVVKLAKSGEILSIDIFQKKSKELVLRFFCDGKNAILCTEWPASKWILKQPKSIYGYGGVWSPEADRKIAHEVIGGYMDDLGGLMEHFISKVYWEKSKRAHDRKYEKMREHFEMYPDYPDDLQEYCELHVFKYTYIFIGKIEKNKRKASCAHCGKRFNLNKSIKSGQTGECPKCGISAVYRGDWISKTPVNKAKICIAHKVDDQLLLRWVEVVRSFDGSPFRYHYAFYDYYYNLHLNTNRGPAIYSYRYTCAMGWGWQWYRKDNGCECLDSTFVYAANLAEVFGENYYRVNLAEGLKHARELPFASLLSNLKHYPPAEYLFKLGMPTLASCSLVKDIKGKNFSDALGVSNQYIPLFRKFDVTLAERSIIKSSRTWVSEENFIKFRNLKASDSRDLVIDILGDMSFEKFTNYFTKQREVVKQKTNRILTWYRDYIDMSRALGVDLSHKSVRFPANIKTAHDAITPRFNEVKHEIEDAAFAQAVEKLYAGMKEYEKGDYCIVYPTKRSEFITEGQSLNHCVGSESYYKNHLKGDYMIFFVRHIDARDKPLYTMEIDMRALRIKQLYGFGDKSAPADVRQFANGFLQKLRPDIKGKAV